MKNKYFFLLPILLLDFSISQNTEIKSLSETTQKAIDVIKNPEYKNYDDVKGMNDLQIIDYLYENLKSDSSFHLDISYYYQDLGQYDKALKVLHSLEYSRFSGGVGKKLIKIYSKLDSLEQSLFYIEKLLQSGVLLDDIDFINNDPNLSFTRNDPRFKKLVNQYLSKSDIKSITYIDGLSEKKTNTRGSRSKRQSLRLAKKFEKGIKLEKKSGHVSRFLIEYLLSATAQLYYEAGKLKKAIEFRNESIIMGSSFNNRGTSYALNAYSYQDIGDYQRAEDELVKMFNFGVKINDKEIQSKALYQKAYLLDDPDASAQLWLKSFYLYPEGIEVDEYFFDRIYDITLYLGSQGNWEEIEYFSDFFFNLGSAREDELLKLISKSYKAQIKIALNIDKQESFKEILGIFDKMKALDLSRMGTDVNAIAELYIGIISTLFKDANYYPQILTLVNEALSIIDDKDVFYKDFFNFMKARASYDYDNVKSFGYKILAKDKKGNIYFNDNLDIEIGIFYAEALLYLKDKENSEKILEKILEKIDNTTNRNLPYVYMLLAFSSINNFEFATRDDINLEKYTLYITKLADYLNHLSKSASGRFDMEVNDVNLYYYELAAIINLDKNTDDGMFYYEMGKSRFLKKTFNKESDYFRYPIFEKGQTFIGMDQMNMANSNEINENILSKSSADASIKKMLTNSNYKNQFLRYDLSIDSIGTWFKNNDTYSKNFNVLYDLNNYSDSLFNLFSKNNTIYSEGQNFKPSLLLDFFFYGRNFKNIKDNHLILLLDHELQKIPFEALIDANGKYLIESKEISYAFSFTIHRLLQERKYNRDLTKILAFANPLYSSSRSGSSLRGLREDINLKKDLSNYEINDIHAAFGYDSWENLLGADNEVENIKRLNDVTILRGDLASEEKLFKMSESGELKNYSVLHFATHALTLPEIPDASSIILSSSSKDFDGHLTPQEISRLELKADFVNLSACETALGKVYSSEGIVSFAHSFIAAGANGVLASLWKVDDNSTSIFMTSFYSHYFKYKNVPKALALTKREFINGDYGEEYKKPFYWAPFIYYGI